MPAAAVADPQAELNKAHAALEKRIGKGSTHRASESVPVNHLPFIEPNLTYATMGGAPFGRFAALYGDESTGKALALDTPIPTPSGWTTMGQIETGDVVFSERGLPTSVTHTSPVFVDHDCYRVVFDDGSEIVADAEHRWATSTYLSRQAHDRVAKRVLVGASVDGRGKWQQPQDLHSVVTTEEIAGSVTWGEQDHLNHGIDNHVGLALLEALLVIDPYVLGAWLGDGSSASSEFHSEDDQIPSQIRACGYEVSEGKASPSGGCRRFYIRNLHAALRTSSLLKNKHIPAEYLRASTQQRLSLLQGLMDTDGSVENSGRCEFTTIREGLAQGVYELICSLGMKARITEGVATLDGRAIGPKWRIGFTPRVAVFRLGRKLDRQIPSIKSRKGRACTWRKIVSCEKVDSVPTRCIAVDSPSHLFLAGRQMVVTHNTRVAYELIAQLQALPHSAEVQLLPRIDYHAGKAAEPQMPDKLKIRHAEMAVRLSDELEWIRETFPDGAEAVYYNAEQQFDKIYAAKIGIDPDRLQIVESTTIEDIGVALELYYKHYPMHVVDSTSSASSLLSQKQDPGKSLMGVDARQWKTVIRDSLAVGEWDPNRNIGILIHQMSTNLRTGGAQAASTRYLRHTSSCSIKFTRGSFLWDKNGVLTDARPEKADEKSMAGMAEADGVEVYAKIEKSRTCRPFRAAGLQFDYNKLHFNTMHELASSGIYFGSRGVEGMILKSGTSWFKVDGEGQNIGQGLATVYARLADDEELRQRIINVMMDFTSEG